MKKIWVVGISKGFTVGYGASLTKLHTKYEPYSITPVKEINPNDITPECSFWMFKYIPDTFMENMKGFESYHMEYTDNEERVKQAWYSGVLSTYKHIMWVADGGLTKVDKRTIRPMKRIVEEANKHRMDYPELWI